MDAGALHEDEALFFRMVLLDVGFLKGVIGHQFNFYEFCVDVFWQLIW